MIALLKPEWYIVLSEDYVNYNIQASWCSSVHATADDLEEPIQIRARFHRKYGNEQDSIRPFINSLKDP